MGGGWHEGVSACCLEFKNPGSLECDRFTPGPRSLSPVGPIVASPSPLLNLAPIDEKDWWQLPFSAIIFWQKYNRPLSSGGLLNPGPLTLRLSCSANYLFSSWTQHRHVKGFWWYHKNGHGIINVEWLFFKTRCPRETQSTGEERWRHTNKPKGRAPHGGYYGGQKLPALFIISVTGCRWMDGTKRNPQSIKSYSFPFPFKFPALFMGTWSSIIMLCILLISNWKFMAVHKKLLQSDSNFMVHN